MNLSDAVELAGYINDMGWVGRDHLALLAEGRDINELVEDGEFAPENIGLIVSALHDLHAHYGVETQHAIWNLEGYNDEEALENA
jgi:hypothetical protein